MEINTTIDSLMSPGCSGNVARKLGILTRKQNDSRAVSELDIMLRSMDKTDPVKYDFALFGLGVFEGFK